MKKMVTGNRWQVAGYCLLFTVYWLHHDSRCVIADGLANGRSARHPRSHLSRSSHLATQHV